MCKYIFAIFSCLIFLLNIAYADRVKNQTAIFSGLDKITGKTTFFKVKIGEKYDFGNLELIPRACYTSVGEDTRGATVFVEITENQRKSESKRIFNGWMFASSPALNSLDHPIYDIWTTGCEDPEQIPDQLEDQTQDESAADQQTDQEQDL